MKVLKLAVSILVCQGAGIIGSLFTRPAIPTWYATLEKPSFTPPDGVFSPVWIMLFTLMGIALFLVWRIGLKEKEVRIALGLFGAQLILNCVWSLLFFGLRSPLAGLMDIAVLWIAIAITLVYFFKISRVSGLLLLPYLAWVSFAFVLNLSIWRMNP
jgi:tryptophan-rich sensory protein